MGKSKSNTGVGFIDTTVDATLDATNQLGANFGQAGEAVGGIAKDLGMNAEKNIQNILQGTGMVLSGNFDNIGSTLLDMGLAGVTGGASLLVNPNDRRRLLGETAVGRKVREGQEAADAKAAADLAAQENEKMRQAESNIAGIVGAYSRAPGRRSTLVTVPGASNTLLTLLGGK